MGRVKRYIFERIERREIVAPSLAIAQELAADASEPPTQDYALIDVKDA